MTELQRNREFYRNADVRPPFTYASLIRQVSFPLRNVINMFFNEKFELIRPSSNRPRDN